MPRNSLKPSLLQTSTSLLAAGLGTNSIFDVRERELRVTNETLNSALPHQERRIARLKTAHDYFLLALTPMIDDAAFDLVMTTENTTKTSKAAIRDLIDIGADALHVLLSVRAEGNLAAGILSEAAGTSDPNLLLPLGERFVVAQGLSFLFSLGPFCFCLASDRRREAAVASPPFLCLIFQVPSL